MAYKNVNKTIHTLLSLKLIKETGTNETAENKHNAKYYMLSEHGIFQLFLNRLDGILIRQLETIKSGALSTNTQSFFRNYRMFHYHFLIW